MIQTHMIEIRVSPEYLRNIMRHAISKEYQHLKFGRGGLGGDSQQIQERLEPTRRAQSAEELPQRVEDLVLIAQTCGTKVAIITRFIKSVEVV